MKSYLTILFLVFNLTNCLSQTITTTFNVNDSIKLTLTRSDFIPDKNQIELNEENVVIGINGRPVFGSDGETPKFVLTNAILKLNNTSYNLQTDDMYNPWFGSLPIERAFIIKTNGPYFYLRSYFSDGAGTYAAEWLFQGKSCIRTILTNDDWIFEYFGNDK